MMSSKEQYFVSRVNQLDAIHLTRDISQMIRDNIFEGLQEISPIFFTKVQPEIDFLIQSAIWAGSVGKHLSTFGQQILRTSYNKSNLTASRLVLHFALTVTPQYAKSITEQRLTNRYWIQKSLSYCENIALILSVLNFIRFLKSGKRPSFVDFLLGLDYVILEGGQRRNIGYDYMTRELIWGGFMELFGLIIPLINYHKIKRMFTSIFTKANASRSAIMPQITFKTICAYCEDRPTLPHFTNCGHIFCYYCIYANILTDPEYTCPSCNAKIIEIKIVRS